LDPETTALPTGDTAAAGAQSQPDAAAATTHEPAGDQQPGEQGQQSAGEEGGDKQPKKEKTPEQREIERLRRRVDNLTRQKYEARAQQAQQPEPRAQQTQAGNDEPVTLTRAELQRMVAEQAQQLAPSITEQQAEIERRHGVVSKLAKAWGQEEFDAKASELDEVFGGLADRSGKPKPATDAIFDADDPKAVIEYLTDPDNADEAERIARLPATRAGREIARIEAKLEEAKKNAKPRPSNAPRPIESVKGGGVPSGMPDPSNTKAYIAWANAQERGAR
jgi:hypothetical protein